jgi:DNA-binding transcriptional LysR family regulator
MEIRELVSFYHVARLRSVSKAAQILGVGQPTISHQLRRLEREFGVVLFDRVKRPIQLTPEGTAILEIVNPIIQGVETLKTYVNSPEDQGSFTLGAYTDLALHHLPRVIQSYQSRYPDVHIRLLARTHSALMRLLNSAEVDLALCARPVGDSSTLEFEELFTGYILLLTPPGHPLLDRQPVQLRDIAQWPLILFGPEAYTHQRVKQALNDQDISYNIVLEVDSAELVKRYVQIGMGVAMCSDFTLEQDDHERFGVVRLDHLFPSLAIGICRLKGRYLGRSLSNFIGLVRESHLESQSVMPRKHTRYELV